MLHDQLQHDLVEVRPMIPAIPAGEVHDLFLQSRGGIWELHREEKLTLFLLLDF